MSRTPVHVWRWQRAVAAGCVGLAAAGALLVGRLVGCPPAFQAGSGGLGVACAQAQTVGLVAHLAFDEVGGTTAADASGSGRTGTLVNGPVWTSGRINNALNFDGVDDYVDVAHHATLSFGSATDFSLAAWIYTRSAAVSQYLIDKSDYEPSVGRNSGYHCYFQADADVDRITCSLRGSTNAGVQSANRSVLANTWYHFALVADRDGNAQVYLNGAPSGSAVSIAGVGDLTSSQNVFIGDGASAGGRSFPFNGLIDDLRIYARALSPAEVQDLYNLTAAPPPACTPNWSCTAWSACASGTQTRTCTDTAACGTTTDKPAETQTCTATPVPTLTITSPTLGANVTGTSADVRYQYSGLAYTPHLQVVVDTQAPVTLEPNQVTGAYAVASLTPGSHTVRLTLLDNVHQALANPEATASVTFTAQAAACTPTWSCTAWSSCTALGTQTRTCTDANACGVDTGKPPESQSCTPPSTGPSPTAVITMLSSPSARMAPHAVHAHAVNSTNVGVWHRAKFAWDFDATNVEASHLTVTDPRTGQTVDLAKAQQGYNAAYLYREAGTYTIRLRVTNESGVSAESTTSVTIGADTRQRFYVDPAGADSPGRGTSEAAPWATLSYALGQINGTAGNAMLLLKRGSTFPVSTALRVGVPNVVVDAYGAGAKPIVRSSAGGGEILALAGANGLVRNISFTTTHTLAATPVDGIRALNGSVSQTVWDSEFQLLDTALRLQGTGALVLGNLIGRTNAYNVIPGGGSNGTSEVVFVGNTTHHSLTEHTLRALPPGAIRLNISYNLFNKPADGNKVLNRLQKVQYATVYRNRYVDLGRDEAVVVSYDSGYTTAGDPLLRYAGTNHITIDANRFDVSAIGIRFSPNAHHVMVRNNIMSCSNGQCIGLGDSEADGGSSTCDPGGNNTSPVTDMALRTQMVMIEDIDLFNNVFLNPSSGATPVQLAPGNTNVGPPFDANCVALGLPIDLKDVRLRNNLIVMNPIFPNATLLRLNSTADFVAVGSNVWPAFGSLSGVTWTQWQTMAGGTEARENVAAADVFAPAPGTYPITTSTGRPVAGVFEDYRGVARDRTTTWVAGAVQSTSGSAVVTPPPPPPACTPTWSCTAWSACSGGIQTRTCTDTNACGTTSGQPATSQSCTVAPPPPTAGECADGRDNDGDGRLDAADPGCSGVNEYTERDELPLGINLDRHVGTDTQSIFVDVFKRNGGWGTLNASNGVGTAVAVPADADGYPLQVPFDPDGAGGVEPQLVQTTVLGSAIVVPTGQYTVYFDGTGTLQITRDGVTTCSGTGSGTCTVAVSSAPANLVVRVTRSEVADHVRNIRILMPGHAATYQAQPFDPQFTALMRDLSVVRPMTLAHTNSHPCSDRTLSPSNPACVTRWPDRKLPTYYSQAHQVRDQGVAFDYLADLANAAEADLWLTVPHAADDEFLRQLAALMRRRLNPQRKLYLELSNEVWNPGFPQYAWFRDSGLARYPSLSATQARIRFYVERSAAMFSIFGSEFAGEGSRLVNVVGTQVSNQGLSDQLLAGFSDPAVNPAGVRPEALAVAAYFGASASSIIANGEVDTITVDEILNRSEQNLTGTVVPWIVEQKAIADRHQVPLLAYEGGQHLVAPDDNRPPVLVDKLIAANRHPRMKDLTRQLFDQWFGNGGGVFTYFLLVKRPADHGSWGALEWMTQPRDQAPKWDAIRETIERWPTGTPLACTPNWSCTAWSLCSASGTQTRTCTDTNACGATAGQPAPTQACTPPDVTAPVLARITATAVTGSTASVVWETNEPATSLVDYGLTTSYGLTAQTPGMTTSHAVAVGSLTAGATYHFRVRSADAAGNAAVSLDQQVTAAAPAAADAVPPAAVQGVAASEVGQTSVVVTWSASADNVGVVGYDLRYHTAAMTEATFAAATRVQAGLLPATAGSATERYVVTGLIPGTTYWFGVVAVDAAGNRSALSNLPTVTTLPAPSSVSPTPAAAPGTVSVPVVSGGGGGGGGGFTVYQLADGVPPQPPDQVTASAGDTQVALRWRNPTDADFVRVRIRRQSADANRDDGLTVYDGSAEMFTDLNLENGRTYVYRLSAYDRSGNIAAAVERQATPQAGIAQINLAPLDADQDGLLDQEEHQLGTDAGLPDTDGDGYSDWQEVTSGHDPLNPPGTPDPRLVSRLRGRILLQVQQHGEAWYVNPVDGKRYYLRDGSAAYQLLRRFGLGITDANLAKITVAGSTRAGDPRLVSRLRGRILLQVQQHGEAWYVNPVDGRRTYLRDGAAAYALMRGLGLGVTNETVRKVPYGR